MKKNKEFVDKLKVNNESLIVRASKKQKEEREMSILVAASRPTSKDIEKGR